MPKTGTYALINSSTPGTDTTTITFSSIPSTFTDLVLIVTGTLTSTNDLALRFNSDSGSNYSRTWMYGDGSVAGSGRQTNNSAILPFYMSGSVQGNSIIHIMDYSNSTTNKTVLNRPNRPDNAVYAMVQLWRSTSAINSITLSSIGSESIKAGSTFFLYGIQAGNA